MSFETPLPPYNASDPHATFLSSSCFEFLLIEVVPLAYRTAAAVSRPALGPGSLRNGKGSRDGKRESLNSSGGGVGTGIAANGSKDQITATAMATATGGSAGEVGVGAGAESTITAGAASEDDAQREVVSKRLEALGYRVGQGIVERFSRDRPRFTDALDVIKFLCKDLWTLLFRKQIDNLKTNHRGVYVLTDNTFKPFSRMSMKTSAEALEKAQPFLWFPCGIIRGALASLGIQAVVQAESMELPGAVFQIKTLAAKS